MKHALVSQRIFLQGGGLNPGHFPTTVQHEQAAIPPPSIIVESTLNVTIEKRVPSCGTLFLFVYSVHDSQTSKRLNRCW